MISVGAMSQHGRTGVTAAALALSWLTLSGCGPEAMDRLLDAETYQWPVYPSSVTILSPGQDLGPADNRAVVIGRIRHVEDGIEQDMLGPALLLFRVEDGQLFKAIMLVKGDGSFYWLLPRGTYLIARYYWRAGPRQLQTAFQTAPGAAVYIGTLRIDVDTDRRRAQAVVQDEFEEARTAFETRNPRLARQVAKHLMVRDVNFRPAPAVGSPEWHLLVDALRARGLPILTP